MGEKRDKGQHATTSPTSWVIVGSLNPKATTQNGASLYTLNSAQGGMHI